MLAIFALTLPIYLLIALGYAATRLRYLEADDLRAAGRLVLRIAMPALIFLALSQAPIGDTLRWDFVAAYGAGSALVFALGYGIVRQVLRQPRPRAALEALGMACSNSAYIGMPIAALAVGDLALQAFVMTMLVENIVIIPAAVILAEAAGGGSAASALRRIAAGMVRNPLLLAVLAGVGASLGGFVPPVPVGKVLALLAPIAAPVALLAIGAAVSDLPRGGFGGAAVARVVTGKLIAHPLAVAAALMLTGVTGDFLVAGVLIAAAPMISIYALFGMRWGAEGMAAMALIAATVVSFPTVSGLLALIAP